MKRHRTDGLSLVFGLIFLAMALSWMFGLSLHMAFGLTFPRAGWILAAALIVLGIVGLLRSLRGGRGGRASEPDELP